jgi:hypothetical protein
MKTFGRISLPSALILAIIFGTRLALSTLALGGKVSSCNTTRPPSFLSVFLLFDCVSRACLGKRSFHVA